MYARHQPIRMASVEGGIVAGVPGNNSKYTVFRGIPYAAPPVGELRWKRPEPVIPWRGVRVCAQFGNRAPQPDTLPDPLFGIDNDPPVQASEDCLYLNVWTPAWSVEQKLPVFVTIHGGAYVVGAGSDVYLDGEAYCRQGIIHVTFNYRLGALGYLAHPDLSARDGSGISGNYGLYDQIAALQWVHENIGAFGGNPENVTIAGQSAGAGSVLALSVSPITDGLFQKGIIQSGFILGEHANCNPPSMSEGETYGLKYMHEMGCRNIEEMLRMPAELLCCDMGMMIGRPFLPVADGVAMVEPFIKTILEGRHKKGNYLYGSTSEERGCSPLEGRTLLPDGPAFAKINASFGGKTWLYSFSRRLPGEDNIGAAHAVELWYEYGAMGRSYRPFNGADYQVSLNLINYWANFIRSGDPNGNGLVCWNAFDSENPEFLEINDNCGMRKIN